MRNTREYGEGCYICFVLYLSLITKYRNTDNCAMNQHSLISVIDRVLINTNSLTQTIFVFRLIPMQMAYPLTQ